MPATARNLISDSYLTLVQKFPLRRIKSAADHIRAGELVLRLSIVTGDRGTAEYLDVLVDLIADYERRAGLAMDASKVSAADLVRHRIQERGVSVSLLAREIGVPQSNLSEMLSGKRDWSKNAIRGLSKQLNISADRFLHS